jgi:hypothetical protein
MNEKKVRRELFILEGSEGFDEWSHKNKITTVIKISTDEFKEVCYDLGVTSMLPEDWESFKEFFGYCTEQSIYVMRKYLN